MNPNHIIRPNEFVQLAREMLVDPHVAGEIAAGKLGEVQPIVQDRPQHPIGKAVVVFVVIFLGQIGNDVGNAALSYRQA